MREFTLIFAGLVVAACMTVGCGGDGATSQDIESLKAKDEARQAEIIALEQRMLDLEARNRALDEQLASVGLTAPRIAGAESAAPGTSPAPGELSMNAMSAVEIAESFDSPLVKEKLATLMAEIRRREEKAQQAQMSEIMARAIRDRVEVLLARELEMDDVQTASMIEIMNGANHRMAKIWADARERHNDPAGISDAQHKMDEIRQEAEDQIAQVLTVDQMKKFRKRGGMLGSFTVTHESIVKSPGKDHSHDEEQDHKHDPGQDHDHDH